MNEVRLLIKSVTSPETTVSFTTPGRATTDTIQSSIHPPAATWTWANQAGRDGQQGLGPNDVGKYGLQVDTNVLFQLVSLTPLTWRPIQDFSAATWTWTNTKAREAQPVTQADVLKIGLQTDINTYYQLTATGPAVWQKVPNPANSSSPFELSTGASDADSYHDFFRVQLAFEDVWSELLDTNVEALGKKLYAQFNAVVEGSGNYLGQGEELLPQSISGATELQNFLDNLKIQLGIGATSTPSPVAPEIKLLRDTVVQTLSGCDMLLNELHRVGTYRPDGLGKSAWSNQWLDDTSAEAQPGVFPNANTNNIEDLDAFPNQRRQDIFRNLIGDLQAMDPGDSGGGAGVTFPDLAALLRELDAVLKEKYRFDVFAPGSINYGVVLNYRQHWQPQSYQVGNLVSTIPLAPQETRRFTTKQVVKRTRNVKEIDNSLRASKGDSSDTWRIDAEIVDRAKNQTNFQKNASGSYGNDSTYKISAGLQQGQDQAVESAQTKRDFHESVVKAAQEYRDEHRMEVTVEETREDETTSYREIRNPNDELTVTYLFYELQRRYLVDEKLYKATPVILVANEVPGPSEIDQAWILRYDWIIKRAILDDSFLPALEYLAANYVGDELTLQVLGAAVGQQKTLVEKLSQQVQVANQALDTATIGLQATEDLAVQNQQQGELRALVKSFFDPLNISQAGNAGDGNSDRARVDFAKDALNRAQAKVNQVVSDLKSETTALQLAIDKYTAAATKHFGMLADIERLRLHVKDNIIHYMQAIWSYEPSDQRYFRLYNLDVPVFHHNTTLTAAPARGLEEADTSHRTFNIQFPVPTLRPEPTKLHQVADLDNLLGFKGNYMMFPMTNFNYMTWYMLQDYIDLNPTTGVTLKDADPYADLTIDDLKRAMDSISTMDPASFDRLQSSFEEIILRLLSTKGPELVVVPSNSLYIEALPGTHPLLEDFKLIHRAIDVKKAQAEARKAELENLRLAGRLATAERGDPDVEKKIIVETGAESVINAD